MFAQLGKQDSISVCSNIVCIHKVLNGFKVICLFLYDRLSLQAVKLEYVMSQQMSNIDYGKVNPEEIADAMLVHQSTRLYQTLHRTCPCGHKGARKIEPRGNKRVLIALFLCGVLPGLIYHFAHRGDDYVCPRCGLKSSK